MEVKNINVRNMKYGDFNDNEYLEQYVEELKKNGVNVLVGKLNDLINWGRSNSVWPLTFATSCCGIEFMCVGGAHTDFARFGWEVYRNSPRQADVIFVFGTIVHKMAPVLKRLYEQLAEPKYVIAVGSCAIGGGPFKNSYHVVKGVNEIIPVDVYVPGCPPRPDAILYGMMQLSRKIKVQDFFKLTVENESVDNNPQSENEDEQD
ncbi:MAG: NADH-quinone oxidoreductase subunit B [Prevotellaceae bacterium]|nr:NADH-quinone oxidoreductase subunit B [Prevotellaceae bacterium]